MDASLRRAAEQEMRRPAPDAPPGKRPRRECRDGAGSGFLELGRFDYRAAEQLAQGAQGFIVTCGFQRGKSATREAIAALEETATSLSSSAKAAFGIVKLPCLGVILLTWKAAQEAGPSLPAPSAVVTRLVQDVHSKKHPPLKHVQRITPVDGMCQASTAAIRQLVASLGKKFATSKEPRCRQHCLSTEPDRPASSGRPLLPFAVAFKSRSSEPQELHAQEGSKGQAREDSRAESVAVRGLATQHPESGQHHEQQGEQVARDVGTSVLQGEETSISLQNDDARTLIFNERSRGGDGERESHGDKKQRPLGKVELASASISRGAAIAAAAESFAAACKDASMDAEVNLRQPGAVVCLEILPVGSCTVAAVSIVESKACVLKPKLILKPLQL